jgi:hypothetical protein
MDKCTFGFVYRKTLFFVYYYLGSKAVVGTKTAAVGAVGGPGGKSSQVQVIFNGKILTPQSLVQRRGPSHHEGGNKKNKADRGFVDKNETIEEDATDMNEKPLLPTRSKRYGGIDETSRISPTLD